MSVRYSSNVDAVCGSYCSVPSVVEQLSAVSKRRKSLQPRRPHGSDSAIETISREIRVKRPQGNNTSQHDKCVRFAERNSISKRCDNADMIVVQSFSSDMRQLFQAGRERRGQGANWGALKAKRLRKMNDSPVVGTGTGVSTKTDSMMSEDMILLLPGPNCSVLGNTPVNLLKTACSLESFAGTGSSWKLLRNISRYCSFIGTENQAKN